jgi:hypothetical protein
MTTGFDKPTSAAIVSLALSDTDVALTLTALIRLRDEISARGGIDESTEERLETLIRQFEEL